MLQTISLPCTQPGGSLYAAATVVKFPFWGRHLAPLLPFIVALVAVAISSRAEPPGFWRRHGLALALAIPLTASSLMLRFSPEYRKDDYRTATRLALRALAEGKVVWWSADPEECALYYGLTPDQAAAPGARLIICNKPTPDQIATSPRPDVLFQSKPDIYDPQTLLRPYLDKLQYRPQRQLPAFTIRARPGSGLEPIQILKGK